MRHERVASSHCFYAVHLYSLPSSVLLVQMLLMLLTNANYFVLGSYENDMDYCRLSKRHTMCRYPHDHVALPNCVDFENDLLDRDEIRSIIHHHNFYRNNIASGLEVRGSPGPQPRGSHMMEVAWDNELAEIARRWASQCQPFKKDVYRDVERFAVWQNINIMNLEPTSGLRDEDDDEHRDYIQMDHDHSVVTTNPLMRIRLHVQTWLDEVENFDRRRVRSVNYALENSTSYLAIAGGMITRVGCGRAIFKTHLDNNAGNRPRSRVEVLVCNYGPIDRTKPHDLYDTTSYVLCPEGTIKSNEFDHLCVKNQKVRSLLPKTAEEPTTEEVPMNSECRCNREGGRKRDVSSSAVSMAMRKSTGAKSSLYALAMFLSFVLLHT